MVALNGQRETETSAQKLAPSKTRAFIFALDDSGTMGPLLNYRSSFMLNLVDKPLIVHILEYLLRQGVGTFDLVLHDYPEEVEKLLEDGSRWGASISYHLVKDPSKPLKAIIPAIKSWEGQQVLIGSGTTLPLFTKKALSEATDLPVFFHFAKKDWSGWAMLGKEDLVRLGGDVDYREIPTRCRAKIQMTRPLFSARDYAGLKESNLALISQKEEPFLFPTTARKVEAGVWISRGVTIEPGVQVAPPVFIGEGSSIKSGAGIGPNAVIENHCIVDSHCVVADSLICQNTYVGENLEVKNCIVDKNALINVALGTQLSLDEEFLLSEAAPPALIPMAQKIIERAFGAVLLLLLLPVYLLLRFFCELQEEETLRLPASADRSAWRVWTRYSFVPKSAGKKGWVLSLFAWLPSLFNVIRGELSFVGTPPRTPEETAELPREWQQLYLKTKPGLITLCGVNHGPSPSPDERYASEAYYASHMSAGFDLKLLFRWSAAQITRKRYVS